MAQNENNKYYWVKALSSGARVGFGEEWQPALVDDGSAYLCGCDVIANASEFEIGPELDGVPDHKKRDIKGKFAADITCGHCGFSTVVLVAEINNSDWKCPRCRDRFAKAALTGILGNTVSLEVALHSGMTHADFAGHAASTSYGYADAMMEVRKAKASGDKAGDE